MTDFGSTFWHARGTLWKGDRLGTENRLRGRNRPELRADERHDPIERVAMILDGGVEVVPACGGPSRAGSDVPGARDSRSAASGEIRLLPWTISLTLRAGTEIVCARR